MNFGYKYQQISNLVKEDILKVEAELQTEIGLFPALDPALKSFLTGKSKRIRPLSAFLYLRAAGIEPEENHYILQSAVEIIHNASLLHDDVVDECKVRRGQNTINNKFNNKTAILTGDYLLASALDRLNRLNNPQITAMCADTMREMCRGEIFQDFTRGKIPSIEEYLKKTEQKTAGLFKTAIAGAMILSGSKDIATAADFAINFGTAFQIRDDLLNILKSDSLKPAENDIKCGIYNAPVIFAGSLQNLERGIEKTGDLLNNYVIKALKIVKTLDNNKYKTALEELLELLNNA